jgi:hypothetical protein
LADIKINEADLLKLDWEGAEYLIISELSALGLMDRIGWLRSECNSRKDNLLLANPLGQTHVFNIDPNYPYEVGMFVGHRVA